MTSFGRSSWGRLAMANEIVKKILHPPDLPNVVKGDGRYLMTLLRQFLAEQAMQVNAANSFTSDDVRDDKEGKRPPIRNFRLTFDQLGGHLAWDSVQDVTSLKCYEVRENKHPGSDVGLLERTPKTHSDRLPISYVGHIYLYAIDKQGQASTPAEIRYTKQRPAMPQDIALTKTNEGTLITFLEIPLDCMGAYIYVDGRRHESRSNIFLYTDERVIGKLEIAYFDQFGEGERGILYLVMPPVDNFLVERNGANLDYAWDPLPIHNVRYEVRVGVTASWENARKLFTTKINKHRYRYPNTGDCYMLIKAIDEHGNYSAEAAYYALTNKEDIHKNVILRLDQKALGYPGAKRNLYYDAAEEALLLEGNEMEGAYLVDVRLPQKYRARNWLEFSVIGSTNDTFQFDDLDFAWDSQEAADTMWNGIAGDIGGVEVRTEIAVQTGDSSASYSLLLPFAGTLEGTGGTATAEGNVTYQGGRWHSGLLLSGRGKSKASAAIPSQFGLVFWIKLQGRLPCTDFVRLVGADGTLVVGYDEITGAYALTGSDGVTLYATQPYRMQDHLFVGVSQTEKERAFYLYSLRAGRTASVTGRAAPIGTFTELRFDVEGGISI